jgi:radical SAM superfamily enzyme YgiQ (UPF0313 family)
VLAFSVSFENDYIHVLQMLRLAGIPLRAADRGPGDPLVVMGGSCPLPEPRALAPFADLIAVGEGEALVPRMMDALQGAADPRRGQDALTEKDGFYVPSRHEVRYHADGTVAAYDGAGPGPPPAWMAGQDGAAAVRVLTPHTEMS